MKKKIFIIVSIVVIIAIIITLILTSYVTYNKSYNTAITRVENLLEDIEEVLKHYNYGLEGKININAKYKGAHGEAYPSYYQYNFEIDSNNNNITFENNGTYFSKDIDLSLLNKLIGVDINNISNLIKVKDYNIKNNKIKVLLEQNQINEILNTNFKNTTMEIITTGLIVKKVSVINIVLDDIKINYQDGKILLNKGNNNIRIDLNSNGYSLNINDYLKMNVFFEDDKDRYSVVIDEFVGYLELLENKITFSTSNQAAIYNGLDCEITFESVDLKRKIKINENDIPILRYFNDLEFNIWE